MEKAPKNAMALQILHQLEAASGRLEKEAILKAHATDPVFKEVCRLTLDPLVNFYIKKLPEAGVARPGADVWTLSEALESIKKHLATRALRGNAATTHVHRLFTCLEPDDREVLRRVLGRNLKCGVSEATVEKIWPDLKLSYPCMLVSPLDSKTKLTFPMIAQTKMDGMRFNAICENGQVSYKTRNGKELDLFSVLDADVLSLTAETDYVLDGELLMVTGHGDLFTDRKTGNGLLTKFQKGTGTAELAKRVRAVVWDIIPLFAFRKGRCSVGYRDRHIMLHPNQVGRIQVAPISIVNSMEEAQTLYQQKLAEGEEGLVLKDPKGPWEDKRVKHQFKMKAELEADLRVTGFLPGSGKYEGKIGSLLVESADGKVKSAVGTGLDDEERSCDPSVFIGQIVAVKYNALIEDKKTGQKSLFLPVFIEVRSDKATADNFSRV
jgi:ATP-dependent DNA ligase